ncbi:hypothetical protein PoB_002231200 [Plakobranchus ocellatus]|uniref:Uncharacterized protein n=1 Tax=Plakobranchus ocellatus TaxID=259542 RepID=A0AAV3ZKL8_9GAST|nr:hypothetical protein PoB_002231200 [Plakobranchus ocellatus]
MEQESNLDDELDVQGKENADLQSLHLKLETESLKAETYNQDSVCLLTDQKPDINLHLEEEPSVCYVTSTKCQAASVPLPKRSLDSNQNYGNSEVNKQQNLKYVKAEPNDLSFSTKDEKPCIEALKASVEAYSREIETKDGELEIISTSHKKFSLLQRPKDNTCPIVSSSLHGAFTAKEPCQFVRSTPCHHVSNCNTINLYQAFHNFNIYETLPRNPSHKLH